MITSFLSGSAPQPLTIDVLLHKNGHLDTESHFSVLYFTKHLVNDRLAAVGYMIPEFSSQNTRLRIDNSIARGWTHFLKSNDINPKDISKKMTIHPRNMFGGQKVAVYVNDYADMMATYIDSIWLPTKAKPYLQRTLGQDAVDALHQVLTDLKK